jgi:hypothetical protein
MELGDLRRFTTEGCSVVVGTVDAEGVPAACRAIAITADDDLARLTVYLPVATANQTIANIATTRRLAVAASRPADHATVQFKGSTVGVRLAREEEAALLRSRLDDFGSYLLMIGVPASLLARINHWPAYAVEMTVEQAFDQTPGSNAGEQLL